MQIKCVKICAATKYIWKQMTRANERQCATFARPVAVAVSRIRNHKAITINDTPRQQHPIVNRFCTHRAGDVDFDAANIWCCSVDCKCMRRGGVVVSTRYNADHTERQATRRGNYTCVFMPVSSSHLLPGSTAATHWKRIANDMTARMTLASACRQNANCQLWNERALYVGETLCIRKIKNLAPFALWVKRAQAGKEVAGDSCNCEIRCALHSTVRPRHQISATSVRSECREDWNVQSVETHSSAWKTCTPGDVRWDTQCKIRMIWRSRGRFRFNY